MSINSTVRTFACFTACALLPLSAPAAPAPKWLKAVGKVAGHVTIGLTVSGGVNAVAKGQEWPGVVAVAPVAFFKEYTDWRDGRDTGKQAITHALTIEAGAGLEVLIQRQVSPHK